METVDERSKWLRRADEVTPGEVVTLHEQSGDSHFWLRVSTKENGSNCCFVSLVSGILANMQPNAPATIWPNAFLTVRG